MKKAFTLLLLITLSVAHARYRPSDYEQSLETHAALKSYLSAIFEIEFDQEISVEPWIECKNFANQQTFFSAPLTIPVTSWIRGLKASTPNGAPHIRCEFHINHFNTCGAKGIFDLIVKKRRGRILFQELIKVHQSKWCE